MSFSNCICFSSTSMLPEYIPRVSCAGPERTPKKKKRKGRGKPSSEAYKQRRRERRRGGRILKLANGDEFRARGIRLLLRWLGASKAYSSSSFSMIGHKSHVSTGWHGVEPVRTFRAQVRKDYFSGAIWKPLSQFFKVAYIEFV